MFLKHRRQQLRQNFLRNRWLVRRLVKRANFSPTDLVLDIGAGTGNLTAPLAAKVQTVWAIEIDPQLIKRLNKRFNQSQKITIIHDDFMQIDLPKVPYKVFANLPFNLQSKILEKLFANPNTMPVECYLILEYRFARKLLHNQKFIAKIIYHFRPADFFPRPRSRVVLVHLVCKYNRVFLP